MSILTDSQITRLLDIALAGCHHGMVPEARRIYDAILAVKPGFVPALIGQAFSHTVVDEFEQAEQLLRDVLSTHPADPDAKAQLGLCLWLAQRQDEATDIFTELAGQNGPAQALAKAMLEQAR